MQDTGFIIWHGDTLVTQFQNLQWLMNQLLNIVLVCLCRLNKLFVQTSVRLEQNKKSHPRSVGVKINIWWLLLEHKNYLQNGYMAQQSQCIAPTRWIRQWFRIDYKVGKNWFMKLMCIGIDACSLTTGFTASRGLAYVGRGNCIACECNVE